MADDRSITGSAATGDDVHDDDELAEVLAAELERYSTGSVPLLSSPSVTPRLRDEPMQPLAVPRLESPAVRNRIEQPAAPERTGHASAARAAETDRALRPVAPPPRTPSSGPPSFQRPDGARDRRSTPGPVLQPTPLLTTDDLPVKRRTGFRAPTTVADSGPVEPLDRVPRPAPEPAPAAAPLEPKVDDTAGEVAADRPVHQPARHAAPYPAPGPLPVEAPPTRSADPSRGVYADWEQSLRSIGRPGVLREADDEVVPTGGDPDLETVAIPVQPTGRYPRPRAEAQPTGAPSDLSSGQHRASGLPAPEPGPIEPVPIEPQLRRRRSGRRRAEVPEEPDKPEEPEAPEAPVAATPAPVPVQEVPVQEAPVQEVPPAEPTFEQWAAEPFEPVAVEVVVSDADDEGIDEVAVDYPVVSAATTGALDLPQVEPRPRTVPVFIERVRTAILQLPSIPPAPTGSGAPAIVGRWFGAFASPLTLVLAFGLAASGAGPAATPAVVLGALLAVPALARTAVWSAGAPGDAALQEAAVLGRSVGRAVAVVLLLARLGASATVLFFAGVTAAAWIGRTGAVGVGASNAALVGSVVVAGLAIGCAALPARATAVLTLLAAAIGTVGTLFLALVLAPGGGTPVAATVAGAVVGAVAGFVGVGLLLVLCGADIARWRTGLANPTSTAVGGAVAALLGAVLLGAGTLIAARLSNGGSAVDEFAGALSDATAGALAAPLLVVLLLSALTLPTLLLRSSGAAAARLLGSGGPVRLGTVAAGLLALAGALGLLAAGVDPTAAALAAAALCGVPVAAWAGLLGITSRTLRPLSAAAGLGAAVIVGWLLSDGLMPGWRSPLLDVLGMPAASALRGGPAVGIAAALVLGVAAGALGGSRRTSPAGPADTVDG